MKRQYSTVTTSTGNLNHYQLGTFCSGEDVEKEACFILGLLAIKSEHQHKIAGKTARLWGDATQALPVS